MSEAPCELSIVIPAYKEATKVGRDIEAAFAFLAGDRIDGEVIVVDDGSPDDTAAVAASYRARYPALRVLSYTPNRGKGHALRYGILRARGRTILFADAGLCVPYDVARIPLAMLAMRMCDVANGSRRMRGSVKRAQPFYRKLGSRLFGILVHGVMGVPMYVSDTQCGFKAYRREVARRLFGEAFTDGFMFDTEIILRALKEGCTILEFPVVWENDADTRFSPRHGSVRILRELLAIRLGLVRGRTASPHDTVTARDVDAMLPAVPLAAPERAPIVDANDPASAPTGTPA
ncbi:MAG TPA: glycosyltransferase [Candidatus Baltobacteraceae bacterium]|nr:glycosyltransferase [Candidatus Baltobacteraceae bacterium]